MALKIVRSEWSGHLNDYVTEIVCDTDADFANLPECCTGSMALSAESGAIQVVNASGEWVPMGG